MIKAKQQSRFPPMSDHSRANEVTDEPSRQADESVNAYRAARREAFDLGIAQRKGTLDQVGSARLDVLQTKMADFWESRRPAVPEANLLTRVKWSAEPERGPLPLPGRSKPIQRREAVIQRHHQYGKAGLDDETESGVEIYKVIETDTDEVVYVGQTCSGQGYKTRFKGHLRSGYHDHWSEETHEPKLIESGEWTLLEAKIAEQYWIEHYGLANLENDRNELTRATYLKYRTPETTPNFGNQYAPRA